MSERGNKKAPQRAALPAPVNQQSFIVRGTCKLLYITSVLPKVLRGSGEA